MEDKAVTVLQQQRLHSDALLAVADVTSDVSACVPFVAAPHYNAQLQFIAAAAARTEQVL
jgi:hypothetical protein